MEDHLLEIFGGHDTREVLTQSLSSEFGLIWSKEAEKELAAIPEKFREEFINAAKETW